MAKLISNASKLSGVILRAFYYRAAKIPLLAFPLYVLLLLMCASLDWNPTITWECDAVESVLRRFS